MESLSLQGCIRDVHVLGIGHLAAAVRVELARRGLGSPHVRHSATPLVVVCSDFENPPSFGEASQRASEQRSPILFAYIEDTAWHPRLLARQKAVLVVDRISGYLAPNPAAAQ